MTEVRYYNEIVELFEEIIKILNDAYKNLDKEEFYELSESIDNIFFEYLGFFVGDYG